METGTLEELNVKPGDVVGNKHGAVFETALDECGCICDKTDMCRLSDDYEFTLVSRAAQPTPDLTAITTPFGLLDEATQYALRAHGGPYEYFGGIDWHVNTLIEHWAFVYRVKPVPTIENETMKIINADGMHMAYATVTTYNGTPNWATLQVKLND